MQDALRDGTLVRLLPHYPAPPSPMHVLYPHDRRLTPKLRSFLDFARAAFGMQA
ncbi:LysR substrate binding domain protein [compost metagenome]